MKHLSFVIWLIGWPFLNDVSKYMQRKAGKEYDEKTEATSAFLEFLIWVFIAVVLWYNV